MNSELILAKPNDVPVIAHLAERIWRTHYTPIIGQAQVNYMLEKICSEKSILQQMADGQLFYLVRDHQKNAGYLSITKINASELFLNKFYIEADEQGRGLGKKTFSELISLFPEVKTIRLQVNRMNYKTVNFYFRLGFIIEESKDFDIGAGFYMNDFVMIFNRKR